MRNLRQNLRSHFDPQATHQACSTPQTVLVPTYLQTIESHPRSAELDTARVGDTGAGFARAFAAWTAPTPLARPNAWPAPAPLAAVFRDLPLELTAKCVMTAMGLRWKHVCDKIRKHSYAIQEGQYLMPPLEYPVFEPVYWPEYGRVCYVITYVLEKGGRRRKRTYR